MLLTGNFFPMDKDLVHYPTVYPLSCNVQVEALEGSVSALHNQLESERRSRIDSELALRNQWEADIKQKEVTFLERSNRSSWT